MEHIYTWPGSILPEHDLIPFIANDDYKGISFQACVTKYQGQAQSEIITRLPQREIDRVFQTVFFFSILQEILGPIYHEEDFVRMNQGGLLDESLVITTGRLEERLQDLHSLIEAGTSHRENLRDHLQECFTMSMDMHLRFHLLASRGPRIMMATFLSYLSTAVERITSGPWLACPCLSPMKIDPLDLDFMVRSGRWCPFEATRAWSSFDSYEAAMLLRSANASPLDLRHSGCTHEHCEIAVVKEAEETVHITELCHGDCKIWAGVEKSVLSIIASDRTAMIQVEIDPSGGKNIEVVPYDGEAAYIAISHVCADGLGTFSVKHPPTCQIENLVRKVIGFIRMHKELELDQNRILIWLDTICVPDEPLKEKLLTLRKMKDIYAQASHVLVLDSWLEVTDFDVNAPLLGIVVLCACRWTRRLWTLQEATFAKKLWFRYANMTVEIEWLWGQLNIAQCRAVSNQCRIVVEMKSHIKRLSNIKRLRVHQDQSRTGWADFGIGHLQNAVKRRLVSFRSDEPLCLAILAGFDVAIRETHSSAHMASFWEKWLDRSKMQQNVIFANFPRLTQPKFGWAPATLLEQDMFPDPLGLGYFPLSDPPVRAGCLQPEGFQVEFPGWHMSCKDPEHDVYYVREETAKRDFALLATRHLHLEKWYCIALNGYTHDSKLMERLKGKKHCALILEKIPSPSTTCQGLLVTYAQGQRSVVESVVACNILTLSQERCDIFEQMKDGMSWDRMEADAILDNYRIWQGIYDGQKKANEARQIIEWMMGLHGLLNEGCYFEIEEQFHEDKTWIVD